MSEQLTLPAEARDRAGKGASRALRREGRVPAVVYGDKKEPLSIHVEEKLLAKMLSHRPLHELGRHDRRRRQAEPDAAQGRGVPSGHAAARSMSISCASASTAKVNVNVPVRFDNEEASPGLKRGGVLNVVRHELELVCDAAADPGRDPHRLDRPRHRRFDPHQRRSSCPKGAKPAIDDRDFTVATIVAPSAMKAEEEEAAPPRAKSRPSRAKKREGEGEAEAEGGEEA